MKDKPVNPKMIELARESRGLTQAELASRLGVTQGKVSKYESGLLQVSSLDLARLAEALDYPGTFFTQTDQVEFVGSGCMYHRKRRSIPAQVLRKIHAEVNIARMRITRLLQGVDIDAKNSFFRLNVETHPGGPELIAREVRTRWGMRSGPIPNLALAIESAGGIVVTCSFGTTKLDAISQWAPGLPPLFFINKETPPDRRRWSLAHEVGHVVMHNTLRESAEMEADTFAAEFLLPEVDVRPQLLGMTLQRAAGMKPFWRTSIAALVRRAHDLGVIGENSYRRFFTQMGQLGYRTVEPVQIADEEPSILRDLIRAHLQGHGYTIAELSEMLNCTERELFFRYLPDRPQLRIALEEDP